MFIFNWVLKLSQYFPVCFNDVPQDKEGYFVMGRRGMKNNDLPLPPESVNMLTYLANRIFHMSLS